MLLYSIKGHFIYLNNYILYNRTLSNYGQLTTYITFVNIVINGSLKDCGYYKRSFKR
jgi:hypothetical protein